jgi:hypothetical protein
VVGVWRELVHVLVKVLKCDCCRCTHSVLLVRAVEEDQVWVHRFSKDFVVVELTVVLAPANLFVFLLYFKLAFSKFLPNKNN